MQSGSNESFTSQAGQQYVDSGSAEDANSPTFGWQFGQTLDQDYLGSFTGPSDTDQIHGNFSARHQPRFLYEIQGNNRAPHYGESSIGQAQQLAVGNMMDSNHINFDLQEPPTSTNHPLSLPSSSNSFPESTCNISAIQPQQMDDFQFGLSARSSNAFPIPGMPQPAVQTGTAMEAGFNPNWPMDASVSPALGLDADFAGHHSGNCPATSLEPLWLAEQTWAAPSSHAGVHDVAGIPAAYAPIGDENTLAHAGRSGMESHHAKPAAFLQAPTNGSSEQPLPARESLQSLGHPSDNPTPAKLWEMCDKKYFCLHQGCRSPFFKRLGDLERHQNNVHTQTKFFWSRSDECDRGRPFPRKDKRNEHERKVHEVDYTLAENNRGNVSTSLL